MEDFDLLNKFVEDVRATPSGPNYRSAQKLMGEECLVSQNEAECAFHLSEAVSSTLRTLPVYRDEQTKCTGDKLYKIKSAIKTVNDIVNSNPIPEDQMDIVAALTDGIDIDETLKEFIHEEELPFHKQYLRFGPVNNVDNFRRILGELPKEWTVVQLTAPYNPHENTKTLEEYRTEINSICVSVFTNEYFDDTVGPITIRIPANAVKIGEKPLFTELYSLLDENYKTLSSGNNGQFYNKKGLAQTYWSKREAVDLRMKSVIQAMDKWLGGWGALLTGRLEDAALRDRVRRLVDDSIADWGFIKLTNKQKVLLYNLIGSSPNLLPEQIRSCIRRILTEHGNIFDIRRTLDGDCQTCTPSFRLPNELGFRCLANCFQKLHNFTLVNGIRAFTKTANTVKESPEWKCLKEARRYPVVLIVDETLDQFPWEMLPILNHHSVCRMENIHFLYYLYKTHEKDIVDGYFMTKSAVGRYVINPGSQQIPKEMANTEQLRVCRVCLRPGGKLYELKRSLAEQFQQVTSLTVRFSNGEPQHICSFCRAYLMKTYLFRKVSMESSAEVLNCSRHEKNVSMPYRLGVTSVLGYECGGEKEYAENIDKSDNFDTVVMVHCEAIKGEEAEILKLESVDDSEEAEFDNFNNVECHYEESLENIYSQFKRLKFDSVALEIIDDPDQSNDQVISRDEINVSNTSNHVHDDGVNELEMETDLTTEIQTESITIKDESFEIHENLIEDFIQPTMRNTVEDLLIQIEEPKIKRKRRSATKKHLDGGTTERPTHNYNLRSRREKAKADLNVSCSAVPQAIKGAGDSEESLSQPSTSKDARNVRTYSLMTMRPRADCSGGRRPAR